MSEIKPPAAGEGNDLSPSGFGQMRQAWVLGLYLVLWLLTFLGVRSSEPRLFNIPAWYLNAGVITLLLVPLNLYIVHICWPRMQDD